MQGRPAYELKGRAFGEAGIDGVSVLHGIMGFDLASGMLSARPLRFHPDLPVVVEAVGSREDIERALIEDQGGAQPRPHYPCRG